MKKLLIPILFIAIAAVHSFSQSGIPNVIPVPPSAYQFLKFDELPVSEYTGVPAVNIPIFEIKEGSYSFPISLSYHAGGVKVSDEASWVGLNWNLDLGTVTQIVNDRDDLNRTAYTGILPDYFNNSEAEQGPLLFPPKYAIDGTNVLEPPPPASPGPEPYHSFIIFTDSYVPVNGVYDQYHNLFNAIGWTNGDIVDSEPDVFKASFNGHDISFVIDPHTGAFVVMDKKNYKVLQTSNSGGKASWKIIAPDGVQYFFEQIDEVTNSAGCSSINGVETCGGPPTFASRIWHITKIITTTGRTISISWDQTDPISGVPSYSDGTMFVTPLGYTVYSCAGGGDGAFPYNYIAPIANSGGTFKTYDANFLAPYTQSYPNTISFSQGSVVFSKSANRLDDQGEVRLDSILVKNGSGAPVHSFAFLYDYFYATTTGGRSDLDHPGFYGSAFSINKSTTELSQRLKLNSFGEVGLPAYQFVYDLTQLPMKTSYATDYWGYYNGKTANTSLTPNPIHIGKSSLGDNSNDHDAYLPYAQAGALTGIIWPTGGRTDFVFELNSFSNSGYRPITTGAGLRVKMLTSTSEFGVARQTSYSYQSGLLMNPLCIYTHYGYLSTNLGSSTGGADMQLWSLDVKKVSGRNFYVSALLGSGNFTGYGMVTKQALDQSGNPAGKTVSRYTNTPDIPAFDSLSSMSLAARKDFSKPDNGLLVEKEIFAQSGNIISRTINNYQFQMGSLYYGAKVAFCDIYAVLNYTETITEGGAVCNSRVYQWEQDLVGYYPLYTGESLLQWSRTSEFNGAGTDSVSVITNYYYNTYNLVQATQFANSKGELILGYYSYPLDNPTQPYVSNLISLNMLDHPITTIVENNGHIPVSYRGETYSSFGGLILVNGIYEIIGSGSPELRLTIDNYDARGNILQYHKPGDAVHSFIWGYANSLPVAEATNAAVNQIAYSGFETSTDLGGWAYTPQTSPPPGKTGTFGFSGSTIGTTGLPSGNYILTFWAKRNGSNGTVSGAVTSTAITSDTWQLYSYTLNAITSVTLNLSSVIIDDLRVYPAGAQMTSYTHSPLVGITSKSDENNQITFYTYDPLQRLQSVSDYQSNITQNYRYVYKSQN